MQQPAENRGPAATRDLTMSYSIEVWITRNNRNTDRENGRGKEFEALARRCI
jgi:hypothetical protein